MKNFLGGTMAIFGVSMAIDGFSVNIIAISGVHPIYNNFSDLCESSTSFNNIFEFLHVDKKDRQPMRKVIQEHTCTPGLL
jgi:hypothetical protein